MFGFLLSFPYKSYPIPSALTTGEDLGFYEGVSRQHPPKAGQRTPEAGVSRVVRGHATPGKFSNLSPLKCDFQQFEGQFEVFLFAMSL